MGRLAVSGVQGTGLATGLSPLEDRGAGKERKGNSLKANDVPNTDGCNHTAENT